MRPMPTMRDSVAKGGHVLGADRPADPVEIVAYDPEWPARFEAMRARLASALGATAVRIDHVGSTAIPGLAAKPVIDIQISVPDVNDEQAFRAPIERQGFALRWVEPGHRYFRPPPGVAREYQVHVCTVGSEWERVHLLFRDYLRTHPDVAAEYEALKRDLATRLTLERIAYNDAKAPFIDSTVARATEWAVETGWRPSPAG
jgi:GrpB-like predicted nucleotidyltransferase (UPF0157 family)